MRIALASCSVAAAGGSLGCGVGRKDTAKVVDPMLVAQGTTYERAGTLGGFRLGPYAIRKKTLKRQPLSEVAPIEPNGLPRPGERIRLELELSAPTRGVWWFARCEALRKPTLEAEFAAVLDETRDAVKIECEIQDGSTRVWQFDAEGVLSGNFSGRLVPSGANAPGTGLDVEILLYRRRFDTVKRHLAEPVAQVKHGREAVVAMVLSHPEQVWIAPDSQPEHAEVGLAILASLDLMPLGFEG